jgi:CheY-like chemotaxis protein
MKKLLYVDDSALQQELFVLMFRKKYEIDCAKSSKEAKDLLSCKKYDLAVVDLFLGEGPNGDELAEYIRNVYPNIQVTILTADIGYRSPSLRTLYKPYERATMEF